ncbi:MAG: glycoside hydrolase family 31 protein [Bacteroidota bacterium]
MSLRTPFMEISRQNPRAGKRFPQLIKSWEQRDNHFFLHCPDTVLDIGVYDNDIIRFRYSPEGYFEHDFSYAVQTPGDMPAPKAPFHLTEVGDEYHLITQTLLVKISKTLHIRIYDKDGVLINEDERGFHWERNADVGGNIIYCSKRIQPQECFFGLGDKPNRLNMRGLRFETWGSDTYGFETTTDPLYKNIPFFLGLHQGKGYGIFFDNSFRTRFDFGYERSDISTFWAKGGEMNYYFIYGPELLSVVEKFTLITGKPELPPMWALGYHQSKWSYYPEKNVKKLAESIREHKIPCDVIHLDIEYMDEFKCFSWDSDRFPDPKRLTVELEADGFKTVAILDPGIKIEKQYEAYEQGLAHHYFCRRADGPLMKGDVWPGPCHFPDFTHPRVREWWAGLVEEFMESGIDGIWNDMNEPAVFEIGTFPLDTRHEYDGHPCSHRKAHNIYGMQMARASFQGMKKAMYPKRPFALTRSGYAGLQRYAAVWTGDNLATWEHLWMANIQCQRLSVSGVSFCGSDIGGFIGDSNGELLTRWMQLGIFHPFFRNHSSGDYADQEPWAFGEPYTSAIRTAIEFRYRLLPYIYSVFWRHTVSGTPILRPLSFIDQEDSETFYRMDEFGFGPHLLACPILESKSRERLLYLPKGSWFNYWTDERVEGGKEFLVKVSLDQIPLFVKSGAIIPLYEVQQYVGEKQFEELDLHVYHHQGTQSSELYEDAGEYYGYDQGNYQHRVFTLEVEQGHINIHQRTDGRYNSDHKQFMFHFHGFPVIPDQVFIDGQPLTKPIRRTDSTFYFAVAKDFEKIHW